MTKFIFQWPSLSSICKWWNANSFRKSLFLIATIFCCSGCTSNYWSHRWRDALDVVTVGYGVGYGAKVQALGNYGALVDFPYAGLRGGELVHREASYFDLLTGNVDRNALREGDIEVIMLFFGGARFSSTRLARGKNYHYTYFGYQMEAEKMSPSVYTQLEVCVGLGPSVRLGVNPGELLDFLLGWFCIDIYGDDVDSTADD